MKNTMKLLGIIALAALIGFSFASCKNGTTDDNGGGGEPTKFEGRWLNLGILESGQGLTDYSYTFTGSNFTFVSAGGGFDNTFSGTFTFTDTTITFVSETFGTVTFDYTMNGNTLGWSFNPDMPYYGTFTKQ